MIKRINCFAKCNKCKKAVFMKKNYWGDKLYICSHNPKKHKSIYAKDCGQFRCTTYDEFSLCNNCSGGEPIRKVLKRY